LVIGCFFVVLYSFGVGNYDVDVIDGSFTFVGAFGSKNQLGFYSSVCVYFSLVTISSLSASCRVRLFCLVALAASAIALVWCRSATSLASLIGSIAILFGVKFLTRFPPMARTAMLVGLATVSVGIALAGDVLGLVLRALGKDATLTGRTYLWEEGIGQFQDNPLLGYGYRAWWIEGRPKAEELWEFFYIPEKTGFHFHNMYIETAVEIGIVGLVLFVVMMIVTFTRYTRLFLTTRDFEVPALLGLLVMMIARSFVEVDFLTAYAPGSFLMFWMLCSSRELLRSRGPGRARAKGRSS
jgi:exopolysaccharide production protein ExoQ